MSPLQDYSHRAEHVFVCGASLQKVAYRQSVRLWIGLASKQRHPACTVIRALKMESIRVIQEVVDAHKEQMPTGVVTTVMEECQKVYDAQSKMYKLTWTVVDSHSHIDHVDNDEHDSLIANVQLSHLTQTLIVEAVSHLVST